MAIIDPPFELWVRGLGFERGRLTGGDGRGFGDKGVKTCGGGCRGADLRFKVSPLCSCAGLLILLTGIDRLAEAQGRLTVKTDKCKADSRELSCYAGLEAKY